VNRPSRGGTDLRRLIEKTLPISRKRASLLAELRAALVDGDTPAVVAIARRLVGLPPAEADR
jgi:hypothetical protein